MPLWWGHQVSIKMSYSSWDRRVRHSWAHTRGDPVSCACLHVPTCRRTQWTHHLPRKTRFLPQTPDLHPELVPALMPVSAHTSPGVDLCPRTIVMALVWPSWVSHFPLHPSVTTSQLPSHPDPPVKLIPYRIALSPCSHKAVGLCVSSLSRKSSWREMEVERWKRAEHSRGLAKECSFLIINHEVKSVSHSDVADSATLRTVAGQAPLSMELSRQENWSGLTFPSPEDLPDPGIKPGSSALKADSLPSEPPGKSHKSHICLL